MNHHHVTIIGNALTGYQVLCDGCDFHERYALRPLGIDARVAHENRTLDEREEVSNEHHRCGDCQEMIEPGYVHWVETYLIGGVPRTRRSHSREGQCADRQRGDER